MKSPEEFGVPDTTYQGLLGDKQFRRFIKLRDYATKKIGMECNGFTSGTRRGKYYLGLTKVFQNDQGDITDRGSVYFAVNPRFFNIEIYGSISLWKKIVQNKDTFCEDIRGDIERQLVDNWSPEKRVGVPMFNARIGKEDSFQDAMLVLKWIYEEHTGGCELGRSTTFDSHLTYP